MREREGTIKGTKRLGANSTRDSKTDSKRDEQPRTLTDTDGH
jgi:hypothetical protein